VSHVDLDQPARTVAVDHAWTHRRIFRYAAVDADVLQEPDCLFAKAMS